MAAPPDDERSAAPQEVIPSGRAELIPPAAELERYEKLVPGAAQMIMGAFDAQGRHRRAQEARIISANIREVLIGQGCGLIFSLSALALTGYCAYMGQPFPAAVVGGGAIYGVVYIFLKGRKP